MNKSAGSIVLMSAVVSCISLVAFTVFGMADEKTEIPDHSTFQSCRECHAEQHNMWEASTHSKAIGQIASYNSTAADCSGCHSSKRPMSQGSTALGDVQKERVHKISCLACHTRQKSQYEHRLIVDGEKLCDLCHTQRSVFWGTGAKGIEDSRNFHSGVPCISCHMTEGNHGMKVLRPDDPSLTGKRLDTCTACHKDNNREARVQQIQEWQSTYGENMAPLLADVKAIEAALKKKPDLLNDSLRSKFNDVKANISILENDGSRGFHNFVFSLEITSLAAAELKEIKAAIK